MIVGRGVCSAFLMAETIRTSPSPVPSAPGDSPRPGLVTSVVEEENCSMFCRNCGRRFTSRRQYVYLKAYGMPKIDLLCRARRDCEQRQARSANN